MEKTESLLESPNRVIQGSKRSSKNPDHPINNELKAHFEDRQRKLTEIKKSKVK